MRLSVAFDLYKRDRIIFANQSAKTEENHEIVKRNIIQFLGDVEVECLTFEHVRTWKQYLDKSRSTDTVRNYVIKLRVVLGFLNIRGVMCLRPEDIPVPKRRDKIPSFLKPEEVSVLIDATARVKNKAIISLLYASGIRISELCSLDRDSIKDRTFSVVGKGGKARLCFIDERTEILLKAYLDTRTDNNMALFLCDNGGRLKPGAVQETFKYLRKKTGIECSPHTMRHSFATNLLRTNCNMRYVQVLLGHSSLQTTQMYTHIVDYDLQRIYAQHHTT